MVQHGFCMGAACGPKDGLEFDSVLRWFARFVLGMEACVTLGMLSADQARRLKDAGLTAYNHNLIRHADTIPKSSPLERTTIAWKLFSTCRKLVSRSAAAESSAWARPSTTA